MIITEINTRVAKHTDLPQIVDLKISMLLEAGSLDLLATNAYEIIKDSYSNLYLQNQAVHFVAEQNNNLLAMVGAFVKSDIPFAYFNNSEYGFICDVYTTTPYRRTNLTKTLSLLAIDWLKFQGVGNFRLLASNTGKPVYAKLGFEENDDYSFLEE
ncbi:MAG: GNAT family N-acetyltransferase [Potamolinea sp.]